MRLFKSTSSSDEKCEIAENDNFETIHDRLGLLGAKLLRETIDKLENGEIDEQTYTDALFNIFNDTSEDTVHNVRDVLVELKRNLYGFEAVL